PPIEFCGVVGSPADELLRFSPADQRAERQFGEDAADLRGRPVVLPRQHKPFACNGGDEGDRIADVFSVVLRRLGKPSKLQRLESAQELLTTCGGELASIVVLAPDREFAILCQRPNRENCQQAERYENDDEK